METGERKSGKTPSPASYPIPSSALFTEPLRYMDLLELDGGSSPS